MSSQALKFLGQVVEVKQSKWAGYLYDVERIDGSTASLVLRTKTKGCEPLAYFEVSACVPVAYLRLADLPEDAPEQAPFMGRLRAMSRTFCCIKQAEDEDGMGVFALQPLPRHFVIVYEGKVYASLQDMTEDQRSSTKIVRLHPDSPAVFVGVTTTDEVDGSIVNDGNHRRNGQARRLQHDRVNAELVWNVLNEERTAFLDTEEQEMHYLLQYPEDLDRRIVVTVTTTRSIRIGEQVLVNYGDSYWF